MNSNGWKLAFTDDQRPYFYHELTKETTWKIPTKLNQNPSKAGGAAAAGSATDPTDPWREAYTDQGYLYYYNTKTREVTWQKPTASNQSPSTESLSDDRQCLYCLFCGSVCSRTSFCRHLESCSKKQVGSSKLIKAIQEWVAPPSVVPFDEYASSKSIDFEQHRHHHQQHNKTTALLTTSKANSLLSRQVKSSSKQRQRRRTTLIGSYLHHNRELVQCQYCNRKFAPSGAARHIEICKNVENRPKPKQ